jgi:hypothetical protein
LRKSKNHTYNSKAQDCTATPSCPVLGGSLSLVSGYLKKQIKGPPVPGYLKESNSKNRRVHERTGKELRIGVMYHKRLDTRRVSAAVCNDCMTLVLAQIWPLPKLLPSVIANKALLLEMSTFIHDTIVLLLM